MSTSQKHCKIKTSHDNNSINDNISSSNHEDDSNSLLPGLPNDLAQLCLSTLPPSLLFSVCRRWRRLIYSPSFPPFFSLYALVVKSQEDSVGFFSIDPISSEWISLPNPPPDPPLHLLHRHPSFISRNLPIQSLTVSGKLVLVAATTHQLHPALPRPMVFNPLANKWFYGPPLENPRRWCAAGSAGGTVYVASGVGSHYRPDVAKTVEKWDLNRKEKDWKWEKMEDLKNGRFSREAVEAVAHKGKLCMVNVKGNAVKEGAVYDVERNRWGKMAEGMLSGWNGPTGAADLQEEALYAVDELKGDLRKYDEGNDSWEELMEATEELKGAEQMAVGRGRVCVVCAEGRRIAVMDVAVRPVKVVCFVDPPPGMGVIAVHILPRMCLPESHID